MIKKSGRIAKYSMNDIHELCKEKNWTAFETEYIDVAYSMRWMCNVCLFEWKNCNRCSNGQGNKYTMQEVKQVVKDRGFILLDKEYKRITIPMNW